MKTFPTLYKRTKTGAIQYWSVLTLQAATNDDVSIQKESGQLGTTSPLKHIEWVRQGKNIGKANETTKMQQANLQAESDWKKKHDEGYKSLEDLSITEEQSADGWVYRVAGLPAVNAEGFPSTLASVLDIMLPQFNTDASGNAKPMLAKAVNWDKVKYPCLVQPKLDGVRCLMIADFCTSNPITFLSRSGKPYSTLEHISKYVTVCVNKAPIQFILDGEIYSEDLSFQEIIAAVKKQRPDSLKLKFRVYDVVNESLQSQRWLDTIAIVELLDCPFIQLVPTLTLYKKEKILEQHNEWVSEGYEGAMIRHMDGIYGQGQRSSDLLKVKEFDETEFEAIGWTQGLREEDLMVVCVSHKASAAKMASKDDTFSAKMVGTREQKAELRQLDPNGKQVTIKHFGWTDDGLPRFPIGKAFRDE